VFVTRIIYKDVLMEKYSLEAQDEPESEAQRHP
jgi:hypothetical protein